MTSIAPKRKIGIAHPYIGRGGSESALLWAVEALKDDFNVSIITTGGVDFEELCRYYGVALSPGEVRVDSPVLARLPGGLRGDALRGALHQRHCRKIAPRYDVLVSAYNPCDFGRPAIHRIADFSWRPDICERFDPPPEDFIGKEGAARRAYLAVARRLSKPSGRDIFAGEDTLVVNSEWTQKMMRELYPNARLMLIYPPVAEGFGHVPWERRENGFVCLGRVAREKRIEDVIAVLASVRSLGYDAKLHLIGGRDKTSYGERIEAMARDHGGWIRLEGSLAGGDKKRLLTGNRYAIHACRREAFGIAVAETARAGCIPFVPDSGGPSEIVGLEPALCWRDTEDAALKIASVMSSESEQLRLRKSLAAIVTRYSVDKYQNGIRRIVDETLTDLGN